MRVLRSPSLARVIKNTIIDRAMSYIVCLRRVRSVVNVQSFVSVGSQLRHPVLAGRGPRARDGLMSPVE